MKIIERYSDLSQQECISVTDAKYIGDFAIRIAFSDGHSKLVDFKPFICQSGHSSIRKYLDEKEFKNFQFKDGNLDWNDFEMCFPIDDLYHNNLVKGEKVSHQSDHF
jgi:hypothetical protein